LPERIGQEAFARIESSYADSFYESPAPLADGVPDMLAKLKEQGYRLGLISNTGMTPGRVFRAYLERLGIIGYFDQLTFSDEILLSKPSLAIFLHTLKSLGYPAHQAVHVGDHLRLDIRGGQRAGMRTVWVQGFDKEKTDIVADATIQRIAELPEALDSLAS
ncbi:MAG: HAD family hydrolase, partial [Chloroflexi bacterium]|nr:HAD family hydrolase [Chloroflexota bacterium]